MAIAFDAVTATSASCSVSSKTITHTCTGSDRILFAMVMNHTAHGTISGVTYNSVAMTKVTEYNDTSVRHTVWYLVAPDTGGAYNLTATCTVGTGCISIGAISFTGASQTGQPDSYANATTSVTTSFTGTTTSVADNSFAVFNLRCASGATPTGGTNTTIGSVPEVVAYGHAFAYSTAAQTPAGSFALNVTSASQLFSGLIVSFSPAGGGGGATYRRKALLGVGQ